MIFWVVYVVCSGRVMFHYACSNVCIKIAICMIAAVHIGAFMMVDHERGTVAFYGMKGCCDASLAEKPQCYCYK